MDGEEGHFRQRGQQIHSHGSVKQQFGLVSVDLNRPGAGEQAGAGEGACVLTSLLAMLPGRVATRHTGLFKFTIAKLKKN